MSRSTLNMPGSNDAAALEKCACVCKDVDA